jgi:hypothetical protein
MEQVTGLMKPWLTSSTGYSISESVNGLCVFVVAVIHRASIARGCSRSQSAQRSKSAVASAGLVYHIEHFFRKGKESDSVA